MSNLTRIDLGDPEADYARKQNPPEAQQIPPHTVVYSIDGPFFFSAAERFEELLRGIGSEPKVLIFRMRRVPYLDATGLNAFGAALKSLQKRGIQVILSAPQSQPLDMMMRTGFIQQVGDQNVQPNIKTAFDCAPHSRRRDAVVGREIVSRCRANPLVRWSKPSFVPRGFESCPRNLFNAPGSQPAIDFPRDS